MALFNNNFLRSVPTLIKKNKFLSNPGYATTEWACTDDSETYQKNILTQPNDWYYRTAKIQYSINKNGYRTHEFNDIDWANSIVMFGCSQIFGVGVDDEHTIPKFLSDILNISVINMGVGGVSNDFILNNSSILCDGYPTPKAVMHVWSSSDRTTYYYKHHLMSHGPWRNNSEFYNHWSSSESHAQVQTLMASKISKQIWSDKTIYLEYTNFSNTGKILGCSMPQKNFFADKGRDLLHYGQKTNKHIAENIAKDITGLLNAN